ncbi:DinB family protein [Aureivirga marina]|uniref:DinB family protein n=1 Tax=Aureivirga marina TaxID=1182451 RepID=UPI0018CA8B47|nr:DinB family protein [Aureivirga marina]
MSILDYIKDEIHSTHTKTNQLIEKIPAEKWNTTPEILETNMNWQLGHLILANYLHGIASISGPNELIRSKINIPDYIKFYGPNSSPTKFNEEKPDNTTLKTIYSILLEEIKKQIETIKEEDLISETAIPNPAAKTKKEALSLLYKHQSWHNGQIAMLGRILK